MIDIRTILKEQFEEGVVVEIPLKKKSRNGDTTFTAVLNSKGIEVSNLGNKSMLEFKAFELVMQLLENSTDRCIQSGKYEKYKLGEDDCTLESINGCLAYYLDETEIGKSVFRRSSAINNILVWCGVCEHIRGGLRLK